MLSCTWLIILGATLRKINMFLSSKMYEFGIDYDTILRYTVS